MIQVARNNIVEQDPSNRPTPRLARDGYGSFRSAWRTLQRIEAVNMIRKDSG
jgi:transposase-like protein